MSKLGKRLIASAKQARAIAQGKADPATYRVHSVAGLTTLDDFLKEEGKLEEFEAVAMREALAGRSKKAMS